MAFIALRSQADGTQEMLGVVRFFADPDYEKAEYAVLVRSDLKGLGLGWVLMRHLIRYARSEGLKSLHGTVLKENAAMIQMCKELGFEIHPDPEDSMLYAVTLGIVSEAVTRLLARPS
jgi:acetyltransferase